MELTTATRLSAILLFTIFTAALGKPGSVGQGIDEHVPQSESKVFTASGHRGHGQESQTRCGACRYEPELIASPAMKSDEAIIKLRRNRRSMVHAGNSDAEFEGDVDGGLIFSGKGTLTVDGNVTGGVILSGKGDIIITGNVRDGVKLTGEGNIDIGGNLQGDIIGVGGGSVTVNGKHSDGRVLNRGQVSIKIKGK